jgi:hypothetical protein
MKAQEKGNPTNLLNPNLVTERGSLGLLAFGIVGLKAWREKRKEVEIKETKKS